MADKFHNKYRIQSARLQNWDYGSNASYFVTICTQQKVHYFGEIESRMMILSEIGKMALQCWVDIPVHFPFVELGEFVVMPHHVHGIIIINKPTPKIDHSDCGVMVEAQNYGVLVEAQNLAPLPVRQLNPSSGNKFGPQSQNLASIIRGFKIGVTKYARNNNLAFAWQSRYYDHIIRNDESFRRISNYIICNPFNWQNDKFHDDIL